MGSKTCSSVVELEMLASGMAKQHETYLDALQELIDNAVAASVDSESYFDDPDEQVVIALNFVRDENTVTTYIADNGPGITQDSLQNHVFRTGNKAISNGILNNVGWGLKASLAWFEESLKQRNLANDSNSFTSHKLLIVTVSALMVLSLGTYPFPLATTKIGKSEFHQSYRSYLNLLMVPESTQHVRGSNLIMMCGPLPTH